MRLAQGGTRNSIGQCRIAWVPHLSTPLARLLSNAAEGGDSKPPARAPRKRRTAADTLAAFADLDQKQKAEAEAKGEMHGASMAGTPEQIKADEAAAALVERALYEADEHVREEEGRGKKKPKQGEKRNKWRGRLIFLSVLGGTYVLLNFFYGDTLGNPLGLMLKYINENEDCSWVMFILMNMVDKPENEIEFIDQGGADVLLKKLADKASSVDVRTVAIQLLYSLSGHPVPREHMCDMTPNVIARLLPLIFDKEREVYIMAVQTLYLHLGDSWSRPALEKFGAWSKFVELGKSTDPEVAQQAVQLIAGYILENPEFLAGRKFSNAEREVVFNAIAQYGQMYQEQGQWAYAAQCYEQSLHMDQRNPVILCQLGKVYQSLGMKDKAHSALKRSLASDPKQCETAYALSSSMLASEPSMSNVKLAAQLLASGVEELRQPPSAAVQAQYGGLHPIAGPAFGLLVDCLQKVGDLEASTDAAQEWALLCHSDPKAHGALGRLLVAQGDYHEALQELDVAIRLDPTNGGFYYQRALALHKLGKSNRAAKECQKAIQIGEARHIHSKAIAAKKAAPKPSAATGAGEGPSKATPTLVDVAKQAAAEARAKPPKHLKAAYILQASLAKKTGDNNTALEAYDKLAKVLPAGSARAQSLYKRGMVLDQLGEVGPANASFGEALVDWTRVAKAGVAKRKEGGGGYSYWGKSKVKALLGAKEKEAVDRLAARCRTVNRANEMGLTDMCSKHMDLMELLKAS